jgi:hypothetical protein
MQTLSWILYNAHAMLYEGYMIFFNLLTLYINEFCLRRNVWAWAFSLHILSTLNSLVVECLAGKKSDAQFKAKIEKQGRCGTCFLLDYDDLIYGFMVCWLYLPIINVESNN